MRKKKFEKKIFGHLESHCQKEQDPGPGNQIYGPKDPDPYQNVRDPEH
jgi:hypothetical protein